MHGYYRRVLLHVYMYSRRHNKVSVPFLLPFRFLVVLPFLLPFTTVPFLVVLPFLLPFERRARRYYRYLTRHRLVC